MSTDQEGPQRGLGSIRVRLLTALAIALAPVLAIGALEAAIIFAKDLENRRESLVADARRSAATLKVRIDTGAAVLETLTAQTVGLQCAQTLRQITDQLDGYENLMRLDALGRVSCASDTVSAALERRDENWFRRLAGGEEQVIIVAPAGYSMAPALLAGVRSENDGRFDGAMAAVISLDSLRPDEGAGLPQGSAVALTDGAGRFISGSQPEKFPQSLPAVREAEARGVVVRGKAVNGERRYFAVAPLSGGELFAVMSSPSSELEGWSRITMASTLVPPVLAFILAFLAVWVATDRVVVRWLHYLQRVAAIYARGRFSVRAVHAARAPPEIAEFARTLDSMAQTIVMRDESLTASLQEKDGLMREIHHRVKNNLQVISSLVSMQQRALEDPVARSALQDTRQRISALSLVYRALYQGPDLKRVDLGPFLEELTAQLVMSESVSGHPVRTDISADHLAIDPDRLAPLALFAVEAITNAQKHAFAGRGGSLKVSFKVEEREARLEIADSGGGGDEAPKLGDGVGRTLMTAFARQLGGKVSFETNAMNGLSAVLTFPIPESDPGGTTVIS